jgi:hypothetical protein
LSYPLPPAPITWEPGTNITAPELRADPGNLAALLTRRPLLVASQQTTTQGVPTGTIVPVELDTEYVDNWSGHAIAAAPYYAQFAGWYLCEGVVFMEYESTTGYYESGIQVTQNSVTTYLAGGTLTADGTNSPGPTCADLVQLNPFTSDLAELFCYQTASGELDITTSGAYLTIQWAGLPTTVTEGEGWIAGTVVADPQPAALWPPGSGTLLTASIATGATSITVAETTGMVVGGTLGLDYYLGAPVSPMAEAVTIESITGTTVGISATSYPHGGALTPGYVAIPVSAAFMNQQVRDMISFLAYPPMARLTTVGTTQTLTGATDLFPAGQPITFTTDTLDNFRGWNSGESYVFPVSGVYYVYGQVFIEAAITNLSAGLSVSGGTTMWGDSIRSQTSLKMCATVRKTLRVTAGQYVQLYGCNNSNTTVSLDGDSGGCSILIVLWRGF